MRTIPLALLTFRGGCPVSAAYLAYLHLHGMRPELILAVDYIGEGLRAQYLRRLLGTRLAARLLRLCRNYVVRLPTHLVYKVQEGLPVTLTPGHEPDYKSATERVISLTIDSYADPRLLDTMRRCGVRTFLYCSGGRVPTVMFQEKFRILHIHPGVLPFVRGSDGMLWSLLVRGQPGASCFYMDSGIDTGRLIATAEFDLPRWPGLRASYDNLYQALIQCYDPHLRASLLVMVLKKIAPGQDLSELESVIQPHETSGDYYSMHPQLRVRILNWLCL